MLNGRFYTAFQVFICLILTLIFVFAGNVIAQEKQRIGTFDSRAVAVAFFNSKYSTNQAVYGSLHIKMKEAKEKNDSAAIADIEREAMLRQAVMHEQGFGTGSVNAITETVRDKLSKLAEDKNLSAVVSKWELVFSGKDWEIVDITDDIVGFFEPDERVKSIVKEVQNAEPIKDAYLIKD